MKSKLKKLKKLIELLELLLSYIKCDCCGIGSPRNKLEPWLTKDEVIEYLRISKSTYYLWVKQGYLVPCSILGEDRFLVRQINLFVAGRTYRERRKRPPKN